MSRGSRYIVVPLWDHIPADEAAELAAELERVFGLSLAPYVVEGKAPQQTEES